MDPFVYVDLCVVARGQSNGSVHSSLVTANFCANGNIDYWRISGGNFMYLYHLSRTLDHCLLVTLIHLYVFLCLSFLYSLLCPLQFRYVVQYDNSTFYRHYKSSVFIVRYI